jgi:serine/threonine protein kinase
VHALAPGTDFAGHRIEAIAGRGGMGIVFRATQLWLERTVALKLICPERAEDDDFRRRFERESRVAASIDHPNVVTVLDAGEEQGLLFVTMEYIDGTDLARILRDQGRLAPAAAADLTAQLAFALDAAHERGLVHCDVKPGNVLVDARGAFLSDFGLSRAANAEPARGVPFAGSLDYAAPEQIEGRPVDARTDVYSLGCLLHHALTGSPPFPRETGMATLFAHRSDTPPFPCRQVPDLPPAFDWVIARALAKDPAHRFRTAGDLGRAAQQAVSRAAPTGLRARRVQMHHAASANRRRRVPLVRQKAAEIARR